MFTKFKEWAEQTSAPTIILLVLCAYVVIWTMGATAAALYVHDTTTKIQVEYVLANPNKE